MGTFRNPGGRPSKFKKKYIADMIRFFDIEPTRKEIMKVTEKNGGEIAKEYKHVANRLPTLVKFAKKIDVDYTTVWRWAEKGELAESVLQERARAKNGGKPVKSYTKEQLKQLEYLEAFCNAYKLCKQLQQDFLMDNGLIGASPGAAYIFTAKNVTSMRDKVENDVRVTEVKPLLDNLRGKKREGQKEKS